MLTALLLTHALLAAPAIQDRDQDPLAQYKVDLVPIGTKVPNFKVKDDMGKNFDLYKTFENGNTKTAFINHTFNNKKTKATIINFWFDT